MVLVLDEFIVVFVVDILDISLIRLKNEVEWLVIG